LMVTPWLSAIAGVASTAAPATAEPRRNFLRFTEFVIFSSQGMKIV
jgi:hypothetical protein